jgi:hypothetical protein
MPDFRFCGGDRLSTRGGPREGAGRKTVDTEQLTVRVKRDAACKLRAEAERRRPPKRKRADIGKAIDDLIEQL